MKKITFFTFNILLVFIFLTGCWSKRELNELAIATSLGIDKTKDGYLISVQILNPSEMAGKSKTTRTEVVRFMKSGGTVFEALRKLTTDSPRKVYLSHIRFIVFGEEMAKEGIGKTLDFLSRDHEMRTDFFLAIAKGGTASEILNVQTALEAVPANKLFSTLENSEKNWAPTKTVTLDELISSIVSKGKEPALTGVYVYGNAGYGSAFENVQNVSPKTGLRIDLIGVFKKDQLVGWLNEGESRGFNYIVDNVKSTIVNVPCDGGKISIETIRSKTAVKGKVEKGQPKININVTTEGNIGEVQCKTDLSKPENIKKLEKEYKQQITDVMEVAIQKMKDDYQSDIFGFGEVIHRAAPKDWKRWEKNWDEKFAQLDVSIKIDAKIRRLGTISESFQKETEE